MPPRKHKVKRNVKKVKKVNQENYSELDDQHSFPPQDFIFSTYKPFISNEVRNDRVRRNLANKSITTNGKIYRLREAEIEQILAQKQKKNSKHMEQQFVEQSESNSKTSKKAQFDMSAKEKEQFEQDSQDQLQSSGSESFSYQSQDQSEEEEWDIQNTIDSDWCIEQFILKNHIGECAKYRLPNKNIQIYDAFYDKRKYVKTMHQLVKYEIIADVNKRIQEKNDQQYQGQMRVQLYQILLPIQGTQEVVRQVVMKAKGRNHYFLQEALIKGQRLGLVTRAQRFRTRNLINKQQGTHLCFIWKDMKSKQIFVKGLEMLKIPKVFQENSQKSSQIQNAQQTPLKDHQYYFMDLDSIISSSRQYNAISNVAFSPLIKTITNHKPIAPKVKRQIERDKLIHQNQIFSSIKTFRNDSQVKTIQTIFRKEAGIFLIQGPPGTGKTQCIANFSSLEQHYFKNGKKICNDDGDPIDKLMICAQSNAAINHIGRKLLKDKLIGRKDMPNILRLGHTEDFDELLLSINLPHLCEIRLRNTASRPQDWSAKLRWDKLLLREKINRIMEQRPQQKEQLRKEKNKLFKKVKRLVEINQQLIEKRKSYKIIEQAFMEESQIVLSTLNTSGKVRFAQFYHKRIRCLLIDEASQATQPSTLIPFGTNVKKVILVGDHMQLQPTVMSNNCRFTRYNRSLFERLAVRSPPLLLDTQYRMLPTLMDFPSQVFYEGRLICGRDMMKNPIPFCLRALKANSMFFDVDYGTQQFMKKSFVNEAQAICVSILIKRLVLLAPELSIGVIAPYKGQVKLIQNMVYNEVVSKRDSLRISTVDAFQGQERDVIIISTVRNNPDRNIGFVRDEKRLNVAITRSKNALFVFGSASTLCSDTTWAYYLNYHYLNGSLHSLPEDFKQCDTIIRLKIELQRLKK